LFLTYSYDRKVTLPGLTLHLMQGPPPLATDTLFADGLYISSPERAILENLQESRKAGSRSKTWALPQIEEKLDQIARVKGEQGLNEFRDRAREISVQLSMPKEFEKLN